METRDRENAPLVAAGILDPPQSRFATVLPKPGRSLEIYGNFAPNNDRVVRDQQST